MGKVIDHQNKLEKLLKDELSNYDNISFVSSLRAKYLAIKYNNKVILTIYFRANEIRIYIDDDKKGIDMYEKLLSEKKVYQHDSADANNSKGKFAFYVNENDEFEIIKRYMDEVYICNKDKCDNEIEDIFNEI